MTEPWILVEDLHLSRGARPILHGINASLSGRAVGLVGANGAGKSTLIGALLGVLRPKSGRVRVMGLEIPAEATEVRTRAGVMAEQAGVFPGGSGVDAVMFAGMLSGLGRREALRRAHRALDALDVGEERYRAAKGYSTGMRQRSKLAMSLVHDPEFLILDEPTVGLDPPGRRQLLDLIKDLRDEGRKILISTHILPDAEYLCDEMLLLDKGNVSYCGPMDHLTGSATTRLVASGPGFGPELADRLRAGGLDVTGVEGEKITFLAGVDAELAAFWKTVADAGAEVRSLTRDLPSLEDAVLTAMETGLPIESPRALGGRHGHR